MPTSPRLFLHQTRQYQTDIQAAYVDLRADQLPIDGVIVGGAGLRGDPLDRYVDNLGRGHAILDPQADEAPVRQALRRPPVPDFLRGDPPTEVTDITRWVAQAIAHQEAIDPPFVISPSPRLDSAAYTEGVQRLVEGFRRAYRARSSADTVWFLGLVLTSDWIHTNARRAFLLDEVASLPDGIGVSLRIRFPSTPHAHDVEFLRGLAEVCEVLDEDERPLLLQKGGILGMFATAFGAWGVSAGVSNNARLETEEIRRRSRGSARVQWFFEPSLLERLRRDTFAALVRAGALRACSCDYCQRLRPDSGGPWDIALEGAHYLRTLALELGQLRGSTRGRRDVLLRRLDAVEARVGAAEATGLLPAESRPRFLEPWRSVL